MAGTKETGVTSRVDRKVDTTGLGSARLKVLSVVGSNRHGPSGSKRSESCLWSLTLVHIDLHLHNASSLLLFLSEPVLNSLIPMIFVVTHYHVVSATFLAQVTNDVLGCGEIGRNLVRVGCQGYL